MRVMLKKTIDNLLDIYLYTNRGDVYMKKSRSIYCTDNEYTRIKIALRLIRVFEMLPINNLSVDQQSKCFIAIVRGDDVNAY